MVTVAQCGLLIILSLFLLLHTWILLKIIPYTVVWGGRLKSDKEMYRFEIISIAVNLFFLLIVLIQSGILIIDFPEHILTIILWIMAVMFCFNTFGNIFSKNKIERIVFTPITIMLTVFSVILALSN